MTDTSVTATDATTTDTKPDLGDAGKRALDAERAARREAERRAQEAERRIAELERAELRRTVAAEKGLSPEQAKHLSGDDADVMNAHADELLAAFRSEEPARRGTPRERLRSGAVPDAQPERTPAEVADSILRP